MGVKPDDQIKKSVEEILYFSIYVSFLLLLSCVDVCIKHNLKHCMYCPNIVLCIYCEVHNKLHNVKSLDHYIK